MADEKRIATFEWLYNNLYEFRKGSPPNNKKGVTKNELITNYNVDESLLTALTDKRLVTRQNCVGNLGLLGIYGINQTIKVDLKGDKYVIIASDNPSKSSEYYKILPKELINNSSTLIETDGTVVNTTYKIGSTTPIKTTVELDVLSNNNSVIKTEDGVYRNFDNNYVSSVLGGVENISVSPNRVFKYNRYNTGFDYIFNNSTGEQFQKPYKMYGFLFDNLRTYSTLSYKQNYPEESFTNTSYSILSNNNSYLVMEQEGQKVRVSKISEDISNIPSNVYQGFIDDLNYNSLGMLFNFTLGRTSRGFTRDVQQFDIRDKTIKFLTARQNLSGGNYPNGTKFFIRFGNTDIIDNYLEYEVPTNVITKGIYNQIWDENSFKGSWVTDAFNKRDEEGFSKLQRFNYHPLDAQSENYTIYAKGTVDLSNLSKMMIGLRNVSGEPERNELLWVMNPSIYMSSNNTKILGINIQRKNMKIFNYNVYPFMASGNKEGTELIYLPELDNMHEIMFKQEKLFEIEVPNLKKSTLITHRSNTNESFIRMEFNDGTIQTRRTSNINNIINQGGDVRTSSIKSPTENMLIYSQPTSEINNISINGENRQMIGIVQNIPKIIPS